MKAALEFTFDGKNMEMSLSSDGEDEGGPAEAMAYAARGIIDSFLESGWGVEDLKTFLASTTSIQVSADPETDMISMRGLTRHDIGETERQFESIIEQIDTSRFDIEQISQMLQADSMMTATVTENGVLFKVLTGHYEDRDEANHVAATMQYILNKIEESLGDGEDRTTH